MFEKCIGRMIDNRRLILANKKYKKQLLNKFIQVFLTTFALLMIVIGIITIASVLISQKTLANKTDTSNFSDTDYNPDVIVDGEVVSNFFGDKKMTTVAVFGVDEDGFRTDVTMLVFFNHETAKIDILSIPRDTQVKIPDEIYETIKARRSDVSQIVKINEVPAYVEDRNETSVAVLEKSLGVDIDYYVKIDLSLFRFIVDEIGDVEVEIPFDMDYEDAAQGLYIHLEEGVQLINGVKAEWLIRYRSGYATGDIGRIEMQHNFMKAFIKQLLNTKNRLNMVNIMRNVLTKADTNFENAVDYLGLYLDKIDIDNFEMHMLPGEVDNSSRSYFIYDYDATKELLNSIINTPVVEAEIEGEVEPEAEVEPEVVIDVVPEVIVDVKNLTISVQNGTRSAGLAGSVLENLKDKGYNTIEAINYEDKPVETTKLLVPAIEVFDELQVYFTDPEMVLAPSMMDDDIQIIIVLGTKDAPE